jgi:dienelactone hydrolase
MPPGPLKALVAIAVLSAGCTTAVTPSPSTLPVVPTAAPLAPTPTQLLPRPTPTTPPATAVPTAAPSPTATLSAAELAARLTWRPTEAPANGDVAGAEWLEIRFPSARSGERRLLAAVFRPSGTGRFPIVVYLHGSSGLSTTMLRWAPTLSEAGFVVLAGCYTLTAPARDRIACPDGPRAEEGLAALLEVAHQIPDAKHDAIGLLGLSAGAELIYAALGKRPDIAAAVADSGSPSYLDTRDAVSVRAAVLLLASPIDIFTNVVAVQEYEHALRAAGKTVEARYYEDGMHVVTLAPPTAEEATQRTIDFFHRHLH